MHNSLWHVVIFSSALLYSCVNGAAPLTKPLVPLSVIQPQRLTNSTSLGSLRDWFKARIEETARGPLVPVLSCFETGLYILGNHLAIESFTGRIQGQGWTSPDVAIAVSTQGVLGNSIVRGFVMWGIFDALCQMKGLENFESAIWTLRMRGEIIGYLSIHPRNLDTRDNRDGSSLWTELDPTLSTIGGETNGSVTPYSNTLEAGGLRVIVSVLRPPRPVNLSSVLLNLVGIIVEAADNPPRGIMGRSVIAHVQGSHVQVRISPVRNLTYRLLIQALTLIPSKLTESRIRDAFQADIYLGTLKAGTIEMLPGPP